MCTALNRLLQASGRKLFHALGTKVDIIFYIFYTAYKIFNPIFVGKSLCTLQNLAIGLQGYMEGNLGRWY